MNVVELENIIEWIESKKALHRWTLQELSEISGYSINGIKKAIDKRTLKLSAIEKIVKKYNLQDEFNSFLNREKVYKIANVSNDKNTNIYIEKEGVQVTLSDVLDAAIKNPNAISELEINQIGYLVGFLEEELFINKNVSRMVEARVSERIKEILKNQETYTEWLKS